MPKRILVAIWKKKTDRKHRARTSGERLTLLSQALAAAHKAAGSNGISSGQSIRAILVVPEYYFARVNAGAWEKTDFASRSLSQEDKEDVVKGLVGLSAKYPSILFVPGTIAWKKPLEREEHESVRKGSKKRKSKSRTAKALAVLKRHLAAGIEDPLLPPKINPELRRLMLESGAKKDDLDAPFKVRPFLDQKTNLPSKSMYQTDSMEDKVARLEGGEYDKMMRNTAYVLFNGRVQFKYNKQSDFHEAVGDEGTVFVPGSKVGTRDIAGIHFGFEVCLDHQMGTLARHLDAYPRTQTQNAAKWPQIHVVTSDSTDNDPSNYRIRDGGYFVHASTDDDSTKVVQRQDEAHDDVPLSDVGGTPRVGGDVLNFWVITV